MRLYLLRGFSLFALFSWLVVLPFAASGASVVYDNTDPTRDSGQYYSSANEFGDEITLDPASTARTMSALTFYYFYDGTSAGNATLRLYDNSGVGGAPGSLLDTSPLAPLPVPATAGHQGSLTWDLSGAIPQVTVPNTFTIFRSQWHGRFVGLWSADGRIEFQRLLGRLRWHVEYALDQRRRRAGRLRGPRHSGSRTRHARFGRDWTVGGGRVGGISQAPPIKIESGWKNLKRGRNERPRFLFHEDMSPGSRRLPDPASHRAPGRRSKPDRNGYFFSLFFGVPVPAPTLSVTTSHLPAAFDFANPPTDSPTVTASKTAGLPSLVIFVAEVIW